MPVSAQDAGDIDRRLLRDSGRSRRADTCPMPSSVGPRCDHRRRSARHVGEAVVLFGGAKIASATSRPTLAACTSKAATISISRTW